MAGRKKKALWTKEEILRRLMRIADEARDATFGEKTDKNGESVREYDVKCASVELKAVEYIVKLSGALEDNAGREICVTMSEDARRYSV